MDLRKSFNGKPKATAFRCAVASGLPLNEMRYHGSQHECELALTTIHAISS